MALAVCALVGWLVLRSGDDAPPDDPGSKEALATDAVRVSRPPVEAPERLPVAPEPPPPPEVAEEPDAGAAEEPDAGLAGAAMADAIPPERWPMDGYRVESRAEALMSFAERASQTDTMIGRLDERATRVEGRLEEARQRGDAEGVALQEALLTRLRARASALRTRSQELHQQAATEDYDPELYDRAMAEDDARRQVTVVNE